MVWTAIVQQREQMRVLLKKRPFVAWKCECRAVQLFQEKCTSIVTRQKAFYICLFVKSVGANGFLIGLLFLGFCTNFT